MSGVVEEEKKEQESSFRASDWSLHLPVLTLLLAFVLFVFNLCLILQVLGEPPPPSQEGLAWLWLLTGWAVIQPHPLSVIPVLWTKGSPFCP